MARRKKSANVQLKVRVKEPLRARIEKAAKSRGVSMNAEMGDRLERSFEIEERFGGPKLVELIETIASVMKTTGEHAGFMETHQFRDVAEPGGWLTLPYAFHQASKAAKVILDNYAPPGKPLIPESRLFALVGLRGTGVDPKKPGESSVELARVLENLGKFVATAAIKDKEQSDE